MGDQMEIALEHHIVLAQIRHAVTSTHATAGAATIRQVCHAVLAESGLPADELRARTFMQFGTSSRGAGRLQIQSPTLPLEDALNWRTKLLSGRAHSCDAFVETWKELLQ